MRKENIYEDCFYGHLPSGLFQLEKSYDQILADHNLIRQMKRIMGKLGNHYNFEVMIKEAYFRCGIILLRPCVHDFYDYIKIFHREECNPKELKDESGVLERIVTCMTHLLLSTRQSNSEGTSSILDKIKREYIDYRYAWQPKNPFEELLDIEIPHNIDFGVRALPLDAEEWRMVNWTQVVLDSVESNIFLFDHYSPVPDWFDESAYHKTLVKRVQELIDVLDFKTESAQLKFLNLIAENTMSVGCGYHWPKCKEIYGDFCSGCSECDDNYYNEQATFCNPLLEKAYNKVREIIISRFKGSESREVETLVMNVVEKTEDILEGTNVEMSKNSSDLNVHESIKKCFKWNNNFVRYYVKSVVDEFYQNRPTRLALLEITLYDHGLLHNPNEHKLFVRALIDWGILDKDTNIKKTTAGVGQKYSNLPRDGYQKWSKKKQKDRDICISIGRKLHDSMKYNR